MNVTSELNMIDEVGAAAWGFVMEGEFPSARRALAKIRNSFCITESERVIAVIEGKILQRSGKAGEAQARILKSIGFLWGSADAFEILSAANPKTGKNSKAFFIEILGGLACVAGFLQFTERHIASFDVIADSRDQAIRYIEAICSFGDPDAREILECREREVDPTVHPHQGVVHAYPFRISETEPAVKCVAPLRLKDFGKSSGHSRRRT